MNKKINILLSLLCLMFTTSCNDWLDLKPNNEQVTDDYWKSKEDVESVVTSGYYYMRDCVPNTSSGVSCAVERSTHVTVTM